MRSPSADTEKRWTSFRKSAAGGPCRHRGVPSAASRPNQGSPDATSRSPPGSGTRLITFISPAVSARRAPSLPPAHASTRWTFSTQWYLPAANRVMPSRDQATLDRSAIVDAVQIRARQWRECSGVQEIDPGGIVVAYGQARPVGTERDPEGAVTTLWLNDTAGPDCAP